MEHFKFIRKSEIGKDNLWSKKAKYSVPTQLYNY